MPTVTALLPSIAPLETTTLATPATFVEACALLTEINEEFGESSYGKIRYSGEELYWIGYLYRYWAYSRKESSKRIYRQAQAKTMKRDYLAFHTFDPDVAIDDLIEIHRQRKKQ